MKHLLNTLFVTSEDVYLALEGENVVASRKGQTAARYPLHTLQQIVTFSYSGASPALMGACAEKGIGLTFCSPQGRFLARTAGLFHGNVLLRRAQYRMADGDDCARVAGNMILGKLYNSRWVLERGLRDHPGRVNEEIIRHAIDIIKGQMACITDETGLDSIRGVEGVAAAAYFSVLDQLILRDKEHFCFNGRNRRPPLDNVNALLSFAYGILSNDCATALESVGLDPYVGFLHRDRPGRKSLALDMMEELRPCFADRFVLTIINNRIVRQEDFEVREQGEVRLKDAGRKRFLQQWQERKKEEIIHPYLEEKVPWGLVPYVQALLFARFLRGDLDGYPPILWK